MLGASQIKLMAGGGVSSSFDPLDVTQYSTEELRSAVESAENWGTYVTVHAYTPRAVKQAIEAGVKCIDHGQLLDDATARLMGRKASGGVCNHSPTTTRRHSQKDRRIVLSSSRCSAAPIQPTHWPRNIRSKQPGVPTSSSVLKTQPDRERCSKMAQWYQPAEVLRMATADNAELLALSGLRSPYPGKLGIVQEGAMADLLLVDGNPLEDLTLIDDPQRNFLVIMKNGKLYKNLAN